MKKINLIIKKNLLVIFRHRLSSLMAILAPLFLIFLAGISYDNLNEYRINVGVYSQNYTGFTDSFIEKLNTEQFKALKMSSSSECIESIKNNIANACIIFPKDLTVNNQNSSELVIYVDYSKINLAWVVKDTLFAKVEQQSTEISENLTQDILKEFANVKKELDSKESMLKALHQDILSLVSKKENNSVYRINASNTIMLNVSILLEKKLASLQESNNNLMEIADDGFDFTRSVISKSKDKDKLNEDLKGIETRLHREQNYIENLFSPDFEHSIPLLMKDLNTSYNDNSILLNRINSILEKDAVTTGKIRDSINSLNKRLEKVKVLKAGIIASPIKTKIEPVTSYSTYLNYIFPTLIVIVIMFGSLLLSSIIVVMERNSSAFFRNYISPTSEITFFSAHFLTSLLIMFSQIVIIILTSLIFLKARIISSIPSMILASLFIASFFILAGMFIGYIFKSEQTSTLAATSAGIVFLLLSSTILPMESMPLSVSRIVSFNPFMLSESILRKSIIFNESVVFNSLYILIILSIAVLVANLIFILRQKRRI